MSQHKYKTPVESAVYLLFEGDKVVYVGESINPLSRIGTHIKQKVFTSYRTLKCHPNRRKYWERVLIFKYRPRYNKTNNPVWQQRKRKGKYHIADFPQSSSYPLGRTRGVESTASFSTVAPSLLNDAHTAILNSASTTAYVGTTTAYVGSSGSSFCIITK